jgi:hypothetical protein
MEMVQKALMSDFWLQSQIRQELGDGRKKEERKKERKKENLCPTTRITTQTQRGCPFVLFRKKQIVNESYKPSLICSVWECSTPVLWEKNPSGKLQATLK